MRFSEFKILTETAKVGREYQHLEDLVFVDGSAGATKAVHILNKLGHDSKDIAINGMAILLCTGAEITTVNLFL